MVGVDLFEILQSLYLLHHKSKSGIFVFFEILTPSVAKPIHGLLSQRK